MRRDAPEITLRIFRDVTALLYDRAGLKFEDQKLYFITSRLQKRIAELGMTSAEEYMRLLTRGDHDGREFQALVDLVTVNETFFFRDFPQLESFSAGCLEEIVAAKQRTGSGTLRVWSAGCSTGEEPYTIAIILLEMLAAPSDWNIRIIGTDIDRTALEQARRGLYDARSLRNVPGEYLSRYFTREHGEIRRVNPELRELVSFEHLNLMDTQRIRMYRDYDFIFCRNVLIYFDDLSRRKVVDHFYVALNRPGFIFLGSSEAMGRITSAFTIKRLSNLLVYGKE